MKSFTTSLFILGFALLTLFSGCGSITKMRYSSGFKSNIEFNFRKNKGESEKRNIASKARKHQYIPNTVPPAETIISETKPSIATQSSLIKGKKNNHIFFSKKRLIQKTLTAIVNSNEILHQTTNDPKPVEPHIKTAGVLFLIYSLIYVAAIIIFIGWLLGGIIIDPYVGLVLLLVGGFAAGILMILSFVLAIIGLVNMSKSRGEYRGAALAITIILYFSIFFILPLMLALIG
jgi:F0F1-type ATP synthase assembly protein I